MYLPTPPLGEDVTQSQFLRQFLIGLNSEFSFSKTGCLTKAEKPSLPNYLPLVGERIVGFIPFRRVLVLCEMQSTSSRIWTRVAVSISYDDNHYITFLLVDLIKVSFFLSRLGDHLLSFFCLRVFHTSLNWRVFSWSLSGSKSPKASFSGFWEPF